MPLAHCLYDNALVLGPTGRLDHDYCEAFREPVVAAIFRIARFNLGFETFPKVCDALAALSPAAAAAFDRG
ncbi:MAG: hypothetical protein WD118_06135 [Phycisphaeraceae bacterium]